MKKKGILITFEGPDGSGKTTQAKRLRDDLAARGHGVVLTREPGGTPFGDSVRDILLRHVTDEIITPMTELLLYESIRSHHVQNLIRPALQAGSIVICDRFIDASIAYQGYGRGVDLDKIGILNEYATAGVRPDLTILIDIKVDTGLAVVKKSARAESQVGELDRIESAGLAFHRRVRNGYKLIASQEPERIVVIKRRATRDETWALIAAAVQRAFPHLFSVP